MQLLSKLLPVALLVILTFGCQNETPVADPTKKTADPTAAPSVDKGDDAAKSDTDKNKPLEKTYTETIPPTLVEFEMVLVPASEGSDAKPFYIGKTEVTWDEFIYWALCNDLKEKKAILEREKKLRPSAPHDVERIYRGWGRENQPVVGISRLAAELYCQWLSDQTGKKYRLPTAAEWDRAYIAGGGELDQTFEASELKKIAWFADNTLDEETFSNKAMPVGKKEPNDLGIHDMLGNVAEWVSGSEEKKVAKGGNFLTSAKKLNAQHEDVEDQNVWNKNYPQDPKSIWWYVDADYVGFRVVCDPN